VIPEGFAHGFQTLGEDCEMLYFHTAAYEPSSEFRINPRDPRAGIEWPLGISVMSEKDSDCPLLEESFQGVAP
jgi:dTDP-4-dehydrorhamnose 3,5-epimerase